jgi:hypothetical protein
MKKKQFYFLEPFIIIGFSLELHVPDVPLRDERCLADLVAKERTAFIATGRSDTFPSRVNYLVRITGALEEPSLHHYTIVLHCTEHRNH